MVQGMGPQLPWQTREDGTLSQVGACSPSSQGCAIRSPGSARLPALLPITVPCGERQKHNQKCSSKKTDTMVLGKLFWLEHFQLGSGHIRGPPLASLAASGHPAPPGSLHAPFCHRAACLGLHPGRPLLLLLTEV